MSDSGAIDPGTYAALSESVGGDQDFLAELINTYLAEAPGLIATMRQTLASMDMDAFRRAAHSLKSSSATFGAARLSALARELEGIARGRTLDGAAERLLDLEVEYQRVAGELARLVAAA